MLYKDLIKVVNKPDGLRYKWNKITDKEHFFYDKISWVEYIPELKWYVVSSAYVDEFTQTVFIIKERITKSVVIILSIVFIISILLLKKVLAPLRDLSFATKRISKGDYDTTIEIKSDDEIGQLANDFNNMIKTIKTNIDENLKKEKLLQQQSRLAQMGEMISMIAHQWRQPLGAISSAVMSIQLKQKTRRYKLENQEDREKFLEFTNKKLSNISTYVQSLSETIDDFRNFFKPQKNKEIIDIILPVQKALNIVEISMSNKGITIEKDFDCKCEKLIYQNELMQVILNILKNSEDNFIEKNIKDAKVFIKTYKENENAIISIQDNGGGIPDDILPNIFDPYFSTKDEKNGTGLGLYMSKIMVEEHNGGSLEVQNIEIGVEFRIIL